MNEEERCLTARYPTIHNSAEIFAALAGRPRQDQERGMAPSEYMKQMLMSAQERLDYPLRAAGDVKARALRSGDAASRHLTVSPGIVLFQRFAPGDVYNATLTIRNVSKVSRRLRISRNPDPFFAVDHGSNYSSVVAPGLVHVYNVRFSPAERRDHEYRVEFVVDDDDDDDDVVFAVPVIAIGPRPVLDMSDQIEIPTTAVKISSTRTVMMRNVGDAPATFNFSTDHPYFSVEPSRGVLEREETMQFTVSFLSDKSGDFKANLFLSYESGEKLCVSLRSSSVNCAIYVDRNIVRIEDTYLGLSRSKTLTIHNESDYLVKFQWMRFKDKNSDAQRKTEYERLFQQVHDMEVVRRAGLVHYDICPPDTHELVCQRIYADEIASLTNEDFRYNHACFLLSPQEGQIWPYSCADITVIFRATEVSEISSVAYLEVTGRQDRIPLSLHGIGKGPLLRLNVITINLENIYMCSVHNYEIVAANKGHINGTLVYQAKSTDFGGTIDVTPPRLTLKPNEYKSFNLSYSSNRKGDFVERIDFVVEESSEVMSLHIKGCIVCPTLHFDKDGLDFGTVALGFSKRQEVHLRNLSLVPVSFSTTMMEDGDQTPMTHEEFARSEAARTSFPTNPREFTIIPQKGVVEAYTSLKLKVTYTANVVRRGQSTIRVDMWDSDSDPTLLPISFCGAIAALSITPAEILIQFSFVNFPYSRSINVENNSNLDGYFYIAPQAISEDTPVVYSLSCHQGFLKARQSKKIDITIITKVLGKQEITLDMLTMDEQTSAASCTIVCNGQGPVVSVEPAHLDFGDIQVLQERLAYFCIINDSPIPAQFKLTSQNKKNVPWLVNPISGQLGPNESAEVEVKIFLRDPGKYADAITVQVANSRSIPINVIASGIGCSVAFEPQIYPMFDMGFLFSRQNQSLPITVRNLSTHHYQITWSNNAEVRVQRSHALATGKFQVEPAVVDVAAGDFKVVQCKICWDANQVLTEDWYVFGHTHEQKKRKLLGTTTFKATFIEPRISFNKRELTFRIDICPDGEKLEQADELVVMNQSRLDLNVQLYVDPPFYLTADKKKDMTKKKIVLTSGTTATIPINFSPNVNLDNPCSRNYNAALWFEYNEHPDKNKIQCKGIVNFPTITLPSKDMIINCILGSTAVKKLRMTNNGPVPVIYKFLWAGESIEINRITRHDTKDFADNSKLQINVEEGFEFGPRLCDRKQNSADRENEGASSGTLTTASTSRYELRKTMSESSLAKALRSRVPNGTCDKLRSILPPTGGSIETSYLSCLEDSEILALMDFALEPDATRESLDDILNIVPHEGTIVPYSSQYACFIFRGTEPMQVRVVALCEILQGPTELINVIANADTVLFYVDKRVIDFDEQLYGETCRSSFTLVNRSAISLNYKINERNLISSAGKSDRTISALTVVPNKGSIDPLSSMEIEIEFQPTLLGAFEIELELQIAHVMPQIITARGVISYPQVYLCVSRDDLFEQHSVGLGYQAIQLLTPDYLSMKRQQVTRRCDDSQPWNRISEWDERILSSDLWDLITLEETFPGTVDIEMAIDRLLAVRFIEKNAPILMKHSIPHKKAVVPHLYAPEYIIDMGYIVVDVTTRYSTTIINYGPWNAEIAMKKLHKEQLEDSGIVVQLKKTLLKVEKTTPLVVTWHPTSARYTGRSTKEQHSIHLEVSRGSTIPIVIRGVITYPFLTLNTKSLNFQTVVVGECLMMSVLVKNEGFINCRWQAKVMNIRKRQEDCQFHLKYEPKLLSPGLSAVINVCFEPRKTCYATAKLKVIVEMGLEEQTVILHGRGTERKLRISDLDIDFPPAVPFTGVQEKIFTIENVCEQPVEFFWHHLDSLFPEEERAIEALIRYYGVKEILLPPRKLGERIPSFLIEFYNSLVSEMTYALSAGAIDEGSVAALSEQSPEHLPPEPPIWLTRNPEEIQHMLTCYIEALREQPDFCENMKDPVKELFDSLERKSIPEPDPTRPAKKVCIIFHGAPFTEYQETACRSARVLRVPLLFIDKVMIEGIALGDDRFSIETRQIIDDAYQQYLLELEKHKHVLRTALPETEVTEFAKLNKEVVGHELTPENPKPPKIFKSNPQTEIGRHFESNMSSRESFARFEEGLAKIPREEDLKFLDLVSLYECKIQAILASQRDLSRYTTKLTKDRAGKRDDTFLGIDVHLLAAVLRERMSLPDFKKGFVLQTLNNIFFKNESTTLLVLLDIVGHVEYSLFVTFMNSMDKYIRKMDEMRELEVRRLVEETNKRIQEIDEMWLSEYELLAEDEKKFYLESTLPIKKQEALQRRTQFLQQMTELRKRKKLLRKPSNVDTVKSKKTNEITKDGESDKQEEKSQSPKMTVGRKATQDHKELKAGDDSKSEKQEMSEELQTIAKAMSDYHSNLSIIENIIKNWDPLKKNTLSMASGKIVRTDKTGDKSLDVNKKTHASEFHTWYVNAKDPWDRVMYDVVVNQMSENSLAKEALPVEISPEPDLQPKKYSILKPSYIRKRDTKRNGTYEVFSLTAIRESTFVAVDSSNANALNNGANHIDNIKRKKRSRHANKSEDVISLNASTIESKDTVESDANTIMLEETPKSRWILQPGDSQKFKIRYQPEEMGTHRHTYALSVIDGDDVTYDINARGIADVSRLDMNPNAVFSKVQKVKIADIHDPAYFLDDGVYDFGSLLMFRKDKSEHCRDAEFKFRNISEIDMEVCFYLEENIPNIFILDEEKLYIPSKECRSLKISAGVTKLGSFTDKMYICVANNPHVDIIELRCTGSKLDIELEDKQVSFDQVLLYRKDFLTRTIRNKSPVQIFWRLVPNESLDPQISFMPISGIVKAGSDQEIEFCYHASKIGTVHASLTVDAFFHENDVESIFTENLVLSGETYDVAVDINNANPIDLKSVRVGSPTSANFTISNRGNYEVKYVILLDERDKLAAIAPNLPVRLKKEIEINPTSGSIESYKETIVKITFLPENEIILKKCPILKCHLLDTNKRAALVAEIPLTVSLVAYYTRFCVYPYPEVNFGSLGVSTEKAMRLHVENTGQFPLYYFIQKTPIKHPSVDYMTQIKKEGIIYKDPDKMSDKNKRSATRLLANNANLVVLTCQLTGQRDPKGLFTKSLKHNELPYFQSVKEANPFIGDRTISNR